MARYKADQGTYGRTTAFVLLGSLWSYGSYTLYYFLLSFRGTDEAPSLFVRDLSGGNLPVLGMPLTLSLIVAIVVAMGGLIALRIILDREKIADVLIDSETEMRKCTWPSWNETFTSSVVILVVMVFFTFVLAGMDFVLNRVMKDYVF
jgi:preprotein translocase SecE subunit